jgi:hypothetical protein
MSAIVAPPSLARFLPLLGQRERDGAGNVVGICSVYACT